jgi:elongation factor Ts
MADITPKMVNDLRERSGAPLMECKRALMATDGDLDKAIDHLRKAGLNTAAKKAGNEMGEGRLTAWVGPKARVGAMVAITCQTDFVAKGEAFQALLEDAVHELAERNPKDVDALKALKHPKTGTSFEETVQLFVGKTGENTAIAKMQRFENMRGRVGCYVHHDGKKGALVSVTTEATEDVAAPVLKDLSMHIVFASPSANSRAEIPAAEVERERAVLLELPDLKGKPAEIQEKILKGRMEKFFAERVLAEQPWFKDEKQTVQKVLDATLGKGAKIEAFARFQIGK